MSTSNAYAIERLPAVMARTGLGRSSIYAAIGRGDFPRPVKLSARAVGFVAHEIDAWIDARTGERDGRTNGDTTCRLNAADRSIDCAPK